MQLRFDWDEAKSASNLRKHGVSFVEASTIFYDEVRSMRSIQNEDACLLQHSQSEMS